MLMAWSWKVVNWTIRFSIITSWTISIMYAYRFAKTGNFGEKIFGVHPLAIMIIFLINGAFVLPGYLKIYKQP